MITLRLDDVKYNVLIHDLVHISNYLGSTSEHFDETNMLMYRKRLIEIRQELLENTESSE
jgi:hypothetical protein